LFASDVITLARVNLDDTATASGQRFSNSTMLVWLNEAQKRLIRDVLFPSGRMLIPTVANQQEYQVGTVLRTDSVYLNGQLLVPVGQGGISTLEGHQVQAYDQGARGGNPAPVSGSGLPQSTQGPYAPSWGTLTPQGYPVTNSSGWPTPDAEMSVPSSTNQRPRYYYRSGYIGTVPASATTPPLDSNGNPIPNLVIDGVFLPPTLAATTDPLIFPDHFEEALAWKVCEFAKFADETGKSAESRNYAQANYRAAMQDLRMWVYTFKGDAADGPKVETSRSFYLQPQRRARFGNGGYP
jgi:hypothetical protein